MDIVLRDIISLGQCCPQVFDGRFHDGRIISEHTEANVAPATQKLADSVGGMAVVDAEDVVVCTSTSGWASTDGADASLCFDHEVVLLQCDAELPFEMLLASVSGVGFQPLFCLCSPLLSVAGVIIFTMYLHGFGASDSSIGSLAEVYPLSTSSTPSSVFLGVDLSEEVSSAQASCALPLTLTSAVELDGDQSTPAALGSSVQWIDARQGMPISSLVRGMSSDVADRFATSPTTLSTGLRSDSGGLPTSAMACAMDNPAVGLALAVLSNHREEYT